MLAKLNNKTNPRGESVIDVVSDVCDSLDAPQLRPKNTADMGKNLAEILNPAMSRYHSPME